LSDLENKIIGALALGSVYESRGHGGGISHESIAAEILLKIKTGQKLKRKKKSSEKKIKKVLTGHNRKNFKRVSGRT